MIKQFKDEVHDYQTFVRNNFHLLGRNYQIIQEQFSIQSGIIDVLAYNEEKQNLVIIELKNIKTNIQVLAQVAKYHHELKNVSILDDYIIANPPEIIIIAPEFEKNFFIFNDLPVKLIQMFKERDNVIALRFFPLVEDPISTNKKLTLKKVKTVIINQEQQALIDEIIYYMKQWYDDLNVIKYDDHVDFMYDKIVAKIVSSNKWFDNSVQLVIYKNFIKPYSNVNFYYDPAIKSIKFFKTMVKLKIVSIPNFIKKG